MPPPLGRVRQDRSFGLLTGKKSQSTLTVRPVAADRVIAARIHRRTLEHKEACMGVVSYHAVGDGYRRISALTRIRNQASFIVGDKASLDIQQGGGARAAGESTYTYDAVGYGAIANRPKSRPGA